MFDVPVKSCKTQDDVNVTFNSSVVFRIMGGKQNENPNLVPKFVVSEGEG